MPSFSVRCIFRWEPRSEQERKFLYEERVTLWQAEDIDAAAEMAEREARRYAEENGIEYLEYWQSYDLFEDLDVNAVEVFSLLRESDLESGEYLETFFDTGLERQRSS